MIAMVLMAGSQLHTLFWPSGYRPVLTTSSVLRVAFTAVVAVGGFLELRRVAAERATSLAEEREYVERLQDLAELRADFTAIVAHELGNPIGTVIQAAELLAMGPLDPIQTRALAAINASTAAWKPSSRTCVPLPTPSATTLLSSHAPYQFGPCSVTLLRMPWPYLATTPWLLKMEPTLRFELIVCGSARSCATC